MIVWSLNKKESTAFIETLLTPPKPNEQLKEAAERYKKLVSEQKE